MCKRSKSNANQNPLGEHTQSYFRPRILRICNAFGIANPYFAPLTEIVVSSWMSTCARSPRAKYFDFDGWVNSQLWSILLGGSCKNDQILGPPKNKTAFAISMTNNHRIKPRALEGELCPLSWDTGSFSSRKERRSDSDFSESRMLVAKPLDIVCLTNHYSTSVRCYSHSSTGFGFRGSQFRTYRSRER